MLQAAEALRCKGKRLITLLCFALSLRGSFQMQAVQTIAVKLEGASSDEVVGWGPHQGERG